MSNSEGFEILANVLDYIRGSDYGLVETKWVGENGLEEAAVEKTETDKRKRKRKRVRRPTQKPSAEEDDLVVAESVHSRRPFFSEDDDESDEYYDYYDEEDEDDYFDYDDYSEEENDEDVDYDYDDVDDDEDIDDFFDDDSAVGKVEDDLVGYWADQWPQRRPPKPTPSNKEDKYYTKAPANKQRRRNHGSGVGGTRELF